ncbi:MAG: hypothetical protein AAGK97_16215, partial [Bacteroidota bacterium]
VLDESGQPGNTYNYTLYAVLNRNGEEIISEPKVISATFPEVAVPGNLELSVPTNTFVPILKDSSVVDNDYKENHIRLDWTYEDEHIDGFKIIRNNIEIAQVTDTARSFEDYFAIPQSNNVYNIEAINNFNQINLESDKSDQVNIVLPMLSPVSHLDVSPNDSLGSVIISFQYLYPGADEFIIYRSDDQNFDQNDIIGSIEHDKIAANSDISFIDKTGTYNSVYYYAVKAMSNRENTTYESNLNEWSTSVSYPNLPPPFNTTADAKNIPQGIALSWEYPEDVEIASFNITRWVNGLISNVYIIPANTRNFVDTLIVHPDNEDWQYGVSAYTEGQEYWSKFDTVDIEKLEPPLNEIEIGADQPFGFDIPSIAVHGEWAIVGNPAGMNNTPNTSAQVYRYI